MRGGDERGNVYLFVATTPPRDAGGPRRRHESSRGMRQDLARGWRLPAVSCFPFRVTCTQMAKIWSHPATSLCALCEYTPSHTCRPRRRAPLRLHQRIRQTDRVIIYFGDSYWAAHRCCTEILSLVEEVHQSHLSCASAHQKSEGSDSSARAR